MARKAFSYIRFSGQRQEAGDSYRRQEAMAEAAAKEEGLPLDNTLKLEDRGVSGFRGRNYSHGALKTFLELVNDGTVSPGSVLIVEQVNRLSRMPWLQQADIWEEIVNRGIIIRTCEPPARYDSTNINQLENGCPLAIYMMMAHQSSQEKSKWGKAAWGEKRKRAAKAKTPHGRMCPAWLDAVSHPNPKDPKRVVTDQYLVNEERAEVVRFIFERAGAGDGAMRIGTLLRQDEVAPFPLRSGPKERADWSPSCIRNILNSRAVLGEYQPTSKDPSGRAVPIGPPIPEFYPAIVSEEAFAAAQAAQRGRRKKGGCRPAAEANLFTHLAIDAESGKAMHCQVQTRGAARYRYLATCFRTQVVPYEQFEDAALDALAKLTAENVDGHHQAGAVAAHAASVREQWTGLRLALDALNQQLRELPPERWPKGAVARMAELEHDLIPRKAEELLAAEAATNTSGRVDAHTELKALVEFLYQVKGTDEEVPVRHRIKKRLPLLLEAIWVKVHCLNPRNRVVFARLYLQGGGSFPFSFRLGQCKGVADETIRRERDRDFRADFRSRGHS
jgi:DNA invertase Pin-like site-specific DNA recombinase